MFLPNKLNENISYNKLKNWTEDIIRYTKSTTKKLIPRKKNIINENITFYA